MPVPPLKLSLVVPPVKLEPLSTPAVSGLVLPKDIYLIFMIYFMIHIESL